jgi:alcohol dehydrogenase class IV
MRQDHRRASGFQRFAFLDDGLSLMRSNHAARFESNVLPDVTPQTGTFNYANPRAIHWGAGSLAQLAPELARLQVTRVAIITTRSLVAENTLLSRVRESMDSVQAVATEVVGQHAPMSEIEAAIARTTDVGVDGIVSFGGGSAIDTGKMVAVKLADRHGLAYRGLPHIAIPTTLSTAELAGSAGFTDAAGDKAGMRDVRLLLDSVIYDAELTLATPMSLWLSTGMRALDHAVEGFLADGSHPFSDVMSLEAVRRLFDSLPRAKAAPDDVGVRTENQLAAWFSFTLPAASANGLCHVMGKQIGARHRIPHGVTSCLLMPHVMRYVGRTKADRMARLAEATGSGKDAAGDVAQLIESLGLPQHIAEYKIGEPELKRAAEDLGDRWPAKDLLEIYLAAL